MRVDRIELGKRIREARKSAGLNQKALGEILGVGDSAISAYENGDAAPPPESLAKIADLGGRSLDWLITGMEKYQINEQVHMVAEGQTDIILVGMIIEAVEEQLQASKRQLSPPKKAELITTLYEMFSEDEEKQIDKKTIARIVRLAS